MDFDGYIMSEDTAVARVENGSYIVLDSRAPLALQRGIPLEQWLEARAIDRHRPNSRLLKKVLRITDTSDLNTVLQAHAVTITDNFWIKLDEQPELAYNDVKFDNNIFADLALMGRASDISIGYMQCCTRTPELTNIGSYEKCWKLEDGVWWMYKQGTKLEQYSEVFVSSLAKAIGLNAALYEIDSDFIKTKDFTEGKFNFEPMASLVSDEEDYMFNYNKLKELIANEQFGATDRLLSEYLDILFIATICFDVDLHTYNYGIMRDRKTGAIRGMAPIFDNNMSLISRGYSQPTKILTDLFCDFVKQLDSGYILPKLNNETVNVVAMSTCPQWSTEEIDRQAVATLVMGNYHEITKHIPI